MIGWNVVKAIGALFLAIFLAVIILALIFPPAIVPAPLVVLVVILMVWAVIRYRKHWWHAFDEKGRPINVEVLPPAPIAKVD
jgi:hypothetical protein